ncbi:MAG: molecular chaperone TorD family protein [Betaproteobacteria bacterium]|nr:molecular chaperone TorD family protein [Betaproteobacteria bacterium]
MSGPTVKADTLGGAYLAMAKLFSYPTPQTWQQLTEQGIVDPTLTQETLEAEYLAAFEVGRDSSPAPLFEGMHREDSGRDGILQDLLRFYEFFDTKLSTTDREYPDHLVTELEFLAWLCMQEQAVENKGGDAESFRRAQRDFITRHVAAWLPVFRRRLEATDTAYSQYGLALAELVEAHRGRLGNETQESGGNT